MCWTLNFFYRVKVLDIFECHILLQKTETATSISTIVSHLISKKFYNLYLPVPEVIDFELINYEKVLLSNFFNFFLVICRYNYHSASSWVVLLLLLFPFILIGADGGFVVGLVVAQLRGFLLILQLWSMIWVNRTQN